MAPSPPTLPDPLTSTRSPRVARLRRLHDRKGRQREGAFLAEGPDCVQAALEAGSVLRVIATVEHGMTDAVLTKGVELIPAEPRVIEAICDTRSSQGIVAECELPPSDLAAVVAVAGPVVVCDGIADPGNLGTILRTAEAVGAAGVITTAGSVDPWNPKAVRAAAGSTFRVPIAADRPAPAISTALTESGRFAIGLSGAADRTVAEAIAAATASGHDATRLAWWVGSEAHGLSAEGRDSSDMLARLPMQPTVESLNAAISVAVCLYAASWT